ncbi:MAG: hypothetical protein WC676_03120 [Candidatus Omnitrophota bacterium]
MKKEIIILSFGLIIFCGCAKLAHLEELLTLKSFSDNQAQQVKYVEVQDKKFALLLEAIKNDQMKDHPDKKEFLKTFGQPILAKRVVENGVELEEYLYRYSAKLSGSEKVYVYFDAQGKISRWRYVEPEKRK